jgi:hypothetical protein
MKIRTLPHGCTNFGPFVARAIKYFRGRQIFTAILSLYVNKKGVSFHTHLAERSRRRRISEVTPELWAYYMELCFILPYCALGIVGGTKRFVKFVGPWFYLYVNAVTHQMEVFSVGTVFLGPWSYLYVSPLRTKWRVLV